MPLIPFTLAWLAGIWLASRMALPTLALGAAAGVAAAGAVLGWRARGARWVFVLALAALLGALRYNLAQPHLDQTSLAVYNDQPDPVVVEGVVASEPDVRDAYTNLRVEVDRLVVTDQPTRTVKGLALVQAPPFADFRYGDRIRAQGQLQTPINTGEFDYREYLARQDVYSIMSRPRVTVLAHGQGLALWERLYGFKARARQVIAQILPGPQAALLTGILLGDDSSMPRDLADAFRATGASHIIAISGYNVTILVGLMSLFAVRLAGRRRAFYLLAVGLLAYMMLVGASASVVRAVIMGLVLLFGNQVGRQGLALNTLFVTALIMTGWNPGWLWDAGFHLSFMATLGLVLYASPIQAAAERGLARIAPAGWVKPIMGVLSDAVLVTLAAQLTTLPILVYNFRQLSLVSLLANALALPVQPGVMIAGGLALLGGLVWIPLGQTLGWVAWLFLAWTTGVVEWAARIPGGSLALSAVSPVWVVAYYAVLGGVTVWARWPALRQVSGAAVRGWLVARLTRRNVLALAGGAAVLLAVALVQRPDGKLHVYFLDVGQGDAILIVTPSGRQVLVDGGPTPSVALEQLARHMPFWDHSLDLVVATQADADHLAGLVAVLERYSAAGVVTPDWSGGKPTPLLARWNGLLVSSRARILWPEPGLEIRLESGVTLTVLHPAPGGGLQGNDASVVTRLAYGSTSFLLTGDIEKAGEAALLGSGRLQPATVLKASHHGAATSTSAEFLQAANPSIVVISVGAGNSFGHPSPEVLDRLAGRAVLRTDQRGTVEIAGDGTRLWVKTEKQ